MQEDDIIRHQVSPSIIIILPPTTKLNIYKPAHRGYKTVLFGKSCMKVHASIKNITLYNIIYVDDQLSAAIVNVLKVYYF